MLAIRDQERAGLDIITDGEQRRESYSNRFATALDGVDSTIRARRSTAPAGPFRCRAWSARSAAGSRSKCATCEVLRANTERPVKTTVPGPFTMAQAGAGRFLRRRRGDGDGLCGRRQCRDQGSVRRRRRHRADRRAVDAAAPGRRRGATGSKALDRALDGVTGTVAVHLCFGYAAMVHDKPTGYSFLPELENSKAQQVSIEAAQPRLDCAVLQGAAVEDHHSRRDRSRRHDGRDAGDRRRAHPPRARLCAGGAPRHGARLRHEISAARRSPSAR